jgi:cell division protein FtsL
MDLQFIAPTINELILLALVIALGVFTIWLTFKERKTHAALVELQELVTRRTDDMDTQIRDFGHQQNEAQTRSLVVTRHLQALQEKQDDFENQIRELKLQDPSLRLYQRAAELVKQGASMQEVMEACDIPRAEAEMLFMVHKQSSSQ